jgi:hypothetical protein
MWVVRTHLHFLRADTGGVVCTNPCSRLLLRSCQWVRLSFWTAATNGPTVHPPGYTRVLRATVEWCWQEKQKNSEKNLSQCNVHHKFNTKLARARTLAPAMRGRRLTAWAIIRPQYYCRSWYLLIWPRNVLLLMELSSSLQCSFLPATGFSSPEALERSPHHQPLLLHFLWTPYTPTLH